MGFLQVADASNRVGGGGEEKEQSNRQACCALVACVQQ